MVEMRENIPNENMIFCISGDTCTFTDSKGNKYNVIIPMMGLSPEWDDFYDKWYWVEVLPPLER
jgi:hypothetical protein